MKADKILAYIKVASFVVIAASLWSIASYMDNLIEALANISQNIAYK